MTKDAEKLLKYIVEKAKRNDATTVDFNIKEITSIPNLSMGIEGLCNELEMYGYISNYLMVLGGGVGVYLTTDGLEYFDEMEDLKRATKDRNITFHINGGQVNLASGNAAITATQNNGVNTNELDCIIRGIMENLSDLSSEDADEIIDVVDMAKEELEKQEPKVSRLRNCVSLISPMFTIANGIPMLADNLQKLVDYIKPFIK